MTTRTFHLGDILSVTTGWLVSPRRMEGVVNILTWMTGERPEIQQIPRATGAGGHWSADARTIGDRAELRLTRERED